MILLLMATFKWALQVVIMWFQRMKISMMTSHLHPQQRLEGGAFLMLMVIMEPNLMKVGGYNIITDGHFQVLLGGLN